MSNPLVLASTSRYRGDLLRRLTTDFIQDNPGVEELPLPGEDPNSLCLRLAEAKALALAKRYPNHLIIGSDQVASVGGRILGKPGDHPSAVEQLKQCSGQTVDFHSGLCVFNSQTGRRHLGVNSTRVVFRTLDDASIESYLRREQPYDCAGSFKCEGLGIALFKAIHSDDPTSLIGLPLILTVEFLARENHHFI